MTGYDIRKKFGGSKACQTDQMEQYFTKLKSTISFHPVQIHLAG